MKEKRFRIEIEAVQMIEKQWYTKADALFHLGIDENLFYRKLRLFNIEERSLPDMGGAYSKRDIDKIEQHLLQIMWHTRSETMKSLNLDEMSYYKLLKELNILEIQILKLEGMFISHDEYLQIKSYLEEKQSVEQEEN